MTITFGSYICGTRERQTIRLNGEVVAGADIYNFPHDQMRFTRANLLAHDFTIYRAMEIPTEDPDVIETWYLVGAPNGPCGWTTGVTLESTSPTPDKTA